MQAHYEALGFSGAPSTQAATPRAARDDIQHPLPSRCPSHDPATSGGAATSRVDDADTLHAEWAAAGVGDTRRSLRPRFRRVGGGPHRPRREPAAVRFAGRDVPALDGWALSMGESTHDDDCHDVRPAAYLTANATSRSLATSCADRPGGFLLGRARRADERRRQEGKTAHG